MPVLRRSACAAVLVTLALTAGCADENDPTPAQTSAPAPSQVSTPIAGSGTPAGHDDSGPPQAKARNDLAQSPVQHVVKASGLTVNATYNPRLPVADWTASASKPLALTLTTINNRK